MTQPIPENWREVGPVEIEGKGRMILYKCGDTYYVRDDLTKYTESIERFRQMLKRIMGRETP